MVLATLTSSSASRASSRIEQLAASRRPPDTDGICLSWLWLSEGGTASLYVDGKKAGKGKVGATQAIIFSGDDGCDVGVNTGVPVSPDYGSCGNEFSGR